MDKMGRRRGLPSVQCKGALVYSELTSEEVSFGDDENEKEKTMSM
jgi:hypothetical protein